MINLNFDSSDNPRNNNLPEDISHILPDYEPNSKMYDFIYQGQSFVRVCSVQPNFLINFKTLLKIDPTLEYEGFEIIINRATHAEIHGPLRSYPIGQLSDPILVSD